MTVAMIRPLVLTSKDFASSSMPKTTPASGALKAAATPAEAPATMRPGWREGDMRPVAYMSEAPTCTVGPSRPIEAPQRRPSAVRMILPMAILSETKAARRG